MLNNYSLPLSDYQRAILTEVGVTFWQFRDPNKPIDEQENVAHSQSNQQAILTSKTAIDSKVKSPQEALAALKHLKNEILEVESTDKVLLVLSEQDIKTEILNDVLMAMGFDNKAQKRISSQQLAEFKDYPLCWQLGTSMALNENQLTTVSLPELQAPAVKKQLWQLIQNSAEIPTS